MNETVTEELARNVKKTTTPSTSDATSFNCRLCKKAFIHECFVIIKEKNLQSYALVFIKMKLEYKSLYKSLQNKFSLTSYF